METKGNNSSRTSNFKPIFPSSETTLDGKGSIYDSQFAGKKLGLLVDVKNFVGVRVGKGY